MYVFFVVEGKKHQFLAVRNWQVFVQDVIWWKGHEERQEYIDGGCKTGVSVTFTWLWASCVYITCQISLMAVWFKVSSLVSPPLSFS